MQINERINDLIAKLPPFPGTILVAISLFVIYLTGMILEPYSLFLQSPEVLKSLGENDRVLQGEWYRLISAIFIHVSIVHLASNVFFLFIFGIRLEELRSAYLLILGFLVCGIVGNVASLLWFIVVVPINSVGSSGAIFGILGINYYLLQDQAKAERRKLLYLLIIFFLITLGQDINFISHLFGLLGGVAIGWIDVNYLSEKS